MTGGRDAAPDYVLDCEQAVLPGGLASRVRIGVSDGVITAVTAAPSPTDPEPDTGTGTGTGTGTAVVVPGTVVPGFVDTHVHGGGGADFSTTDVGEARRVIAFHRAGGTTTSFASLVTAELDVLVAQIEVLAGLCDTGELAGIHLEGPFLSPARCGAHDPALLREPAPADVQRLIDAASGHLSMVTLAPELPGAPEAIDQLVAAGVTVAVGHTEPSREQIALGLAGGARVATHLFNAMPPIHHRSPGPVPLLLTDPGVLVELICDGAHVHPDVLAMAVHAAGPDRVALITDAMAAAGMDDGDYRIGALEVSVRDRVARLVGPDRTPGSIAGSTLTMADAVRYLVQVVGVELPLAARMASTTPAAWHGLGGRGVLEPGARADLVVLDADLAVDAVMRDGRWLGEPSSGRR